MKITDLIHGKDTTFSFEVLPPKKGEGIEGLEQTVETLLEYSPAYINITTHHSEPVYTPRADGLMQMEMVRRRPGTVAVAAALQYKYNIPVVPHILCQGFTKEETEYVLLDLQFLKIQNLLLLRGDRTTTGCNSVTSHEHTTDLQQQVNRFNEGYFVNCSPIPSPGCRFRYGVACYPEKHDESPNLASDIAWLQRKVELGADYAVTQMFFDNQKYYDFVEKVRNLGIRIPIIPGIKPITNPKQLVSIPRSFHCDLPEELTNRMMSAKTKEEQFEVGVDWAVSQCRDLIKHGVPGLHFYTTSQARSVAAVVQKVF